MGIMMIMMISCSIDDLIWNSIISSSQTWICQESVPGSCYLWSNLIELKVHTQTVDIENKYEIAGNAWCRFFPANWYVNVACFILKLNSHFLRMFWGFGRKYKHDSELR